MSNETAVDLSDASEYDALTGEGVVLVDFYADWCGPCKMLAPTLDEIAADGHNVVKVNVEDYSNIANENAVQSVPTLVLLVDGEVEERWAGAVDEATLVDAFENYE